MSSVRTTAARVLEQVEAGRATLGAAVDRARAEVADDRDRGLLLELTSGTLRWRGELDAILAGASGRRVDDIERPVLQALRLGAYQLRHLTRVPAHAVVDEAVESVRALGRARAAGFTNAVLRGVGRGAGLDAVPARPEPDAPTAAKVAYLATALSHPTWLVNRWLGRYGFDQTEAWCHFNNAVPTMTVRARSAEDADAVTAAVLAAEPAATRTAAPPGAIRLPPGSLGRLPAALRGEIAVQDEGSQLVAHVVSPAPGMRCLDVCAAPGGKTTVLWRDMRGEGLLVAGDRRRARVRLLASTLRAAGVPTRVVALDAGAPLPFGAIFDRVLLDAPCSGLGTIRRDPDVKWARTEADLSRFAATQRTMLTEAAGVVRPGGRLIYATCSSEPEENEVVVNAFLDADRRFTMAVDAAAPEPRRYVSEDGFFRTLPFRDGLDAFFAAVLVRSTSA